MNFKKQQDKIERARMTLKYEIEKLVRELEKISGLELIWNDFPGDGIGINIPINDSDTYMPIDDLLKVIERKGTFTEDDIETSL